MVSKLCVECKETLSNTYRSICDDCFNDQLKFKIREEDVEMVNHKNFKNDNHVVSV